MFPALAKLSTPAENLGQNVRGQSVLAKVSWPNYPWPNYPTFVSEIQLGQWRNIPGDLGQI